MTEQQKRAELERITERIEIADANFLPATARSWRELHWNLGTRPAEQVVFVQQGKVSDDEANRVV